MWSILYISFIRLTRPVITLDGITIPFSDKWTEWWSDCSRIFSMSAAMPKIRPCDLNSNLKFSVYNRSREVMAMLLLRGTLSNFLGYFKTTFVLSIFFFSPSLPSPLSHFYFSPSCFLGLPEALSWHLILNRSQSTSGNGWVAPFRLILPQMTIINYGQNTPNN